MRAYIGNIKLERDIRRRWIDAGRRPAIASDPQKLENFVHSSPGSLPSPCVRPGCQMQSIEGLYYCGKHNPRFLKIRPRT